MKLPAHVALSRLWLKLLEERLATTSHWPEALHGDIAIVVDGGDDRTALGVLRLPPGRGSPHPATRRCEVTIDGGKIAGFFTAAQVPPATFRVQGDAALFEGLIATLASSPKPGSMLEMRLRR